MEMLFDPKLRAMRRDRAARTGPVLFLHERAFSDILDRLALINRQFDDILLVGAPDPSWPRRLAEAEKKIRIVDPGPLFAAAAGGTVAQETRLGIDPESVDLIVAIGTLDTVDGLPETLAGMRFALRPGGLLIGAMAGGDSLPLLRSSMAAADAVMSQASPHVHPRIDPASLTQLLANAGLAMPVVDVDRIEIRYPGLDRLVADLRAMGATNILNARTRRSLPRKAFLAAREQFDTFAEKDGKSREVIEILHFMGWAPSTAQNRH